MRALPWTLFLTVMLCLSKAPPRVVTAAQPSALDVTGPRIAATTAQRITITGAGATPQTLTVTVGEPVQWWNDDSIAHTVTADDGAFTPITLAPGDLSSAIAPTAGTHPYHIDHVTNPTGTLVVQDNPPSATPPATPPATATPTDGSPGSTPTDTATTSAAPTQTSAPSDTTSPTPGTPGATATGTPTEMASATDTSTSTPDPSTAPVVIAADAFNPRTVSVTVGMAVQWTNTTSATVFLVGQNGTFTAGPIAPAGSAMTRFIAVGVYPYARQDVTGITGTVVVLPSGATPTAMPSVTPTDTSVATPTPIATDTAVASPSAVPNTPTPSATINTTSPTPTPATSTPNTTPTAAVTPPASPTPAVPAPSGTPPSDASTPGATATGTSVATPPAGTGVATVIPTAATAITGSATPGAPTPTATATPSASVPPDTMPVTITDAGLDPVAVTITAGMYVEWTNLTAATVAITGSGPGGAFGDVPIQPQGTWRQRFGQPGRYAYTVSGGPGILGNVTVLASVATPSATPAATDTPSPTSVPPEVPTVTPPPTSAPSASATAAATPVPALASLPTATQSAGNGAPSDAGATATPTATSPPRQATVVVPPTPRATADPTPISRATSRPTATATRPARPASTPTRTPARPAPTPTRAPTRVTHGADQSVTVELSGRGYLQRGRARVALAVALSLRHDRLRATMRVDDASAHVHLTLTRVAWLRHAPHGLACDGMVRTGHRVVPFTLVVGTWRHGWTLALVVRSLRYRAGGPFHGRLTLRVAHLASAYRVKGP